MSASKTTDWNSPDDAVQFLRGNGWRFDHKWGWLLPRITYRVNEKEDRAFRYLRSRPEFQYPGGNL